MNPNTSTLFVGPPSDPMDTFDIDSLKFPHPTGWCVEQSIQHSWRHLLQHSFYGPIRSEAVRYCINCGQSQSRTPEHTVSATPWKND